MRFFPRYAQDNYSTNLLTGTVGIVRQLLGTMTLTPVYRLLQFILPGVFANQSVIDMAASTGTNYGYWELDASLSPALILLLAGGAAVFLFRKPNLKTPVNKKRILASLCLIAAIWLAIEFTLAKGIVYPFIGDLPIFSSLRVNTRNVSALIFPLALVGAVIFDRWTKNWRSKKGLLVTFVLMDGFALGALLAYHWVPTAYEVVAFYRINQFDYRPILDTYNKIRYKGDIFPIEHVIPDEDPWLVFMDHATSTIDPYNTYFKGLSGYGDALHEGSVYDIYDGYYNIINPTGYIFPEVNNTTEYERISTADEGKFLDFINRRQPKWKLPLLQQALDWTSLISFITEICIICGYLIRKRVRIPGFDSTASMAKST
jgi:hypothetical protein